MQLGRPALREDLDDAYLQINLTYPRTYHLYTAVPLTKNLLSLLRSD